jgi:hypothetical protein
MVANPAIYEERRGKKRLLYWLYSVSEARPKRRVSPLQKVALA